MKRTPTRRNNNGSTAKKRALGRDRQQKQRKKTSRTERDAGVTREEKRREEKKESVSVPHTHELSLEDDEADAKAEGQETELEDGQEDARQVSARNSKKPPKSRKKAAVSRKKSSRAMRAVPVGKGDKQRLSAVWEYAKDEFPELLETPGDVDFLRGSVRNFADHGEANEWPWAVWQPRLRRWVRDDLERHRK